MDVLSANLRSLACAGTFSFVNLTTRMATTSHFAGAVRCKLPGLKVSSYSAWGWQSLRLPTA